MSKARREIVAPDPDSAFELAARNIAKARGISIADARKLCKCLDASYRHNCRLIRRVLMLEGYCDPRKSIWESLIEYVADLEQIPPEQAAALAPGEMIEMLRPVLAALTGDLVRLDQIAAIVGRSKHTLRKWVRSGKLPGPTIEGGEGQPHLYSWRECRPRLQLLVGRRLPLRFPANVH